MRTARNGFSGIISPDEPPLWLRALSFGNENFVTQATIPLMFIKHLCIFGENNSTIAVIRSCYSTIRKRTEKLCEPLHTEDYVPQPVAYASPPKWHLAHTSWFFEEMILKHYLPGYKAFDPDFGFLFNSYYNAVGTRTFRADRGNITRPGVREVYTYRQHVDRHMLELLQDDEPDRKVHDLVILGLNHEQQHQELLVTDFKYALGHNPTFPVYHESANWIGQHNTQTGWLSIPEGLYTIGHKNDGFCFDNECNAHQVFLNDFEMSKALVTNSEYLAFMEDGGYDHFGWWLDEGWEWIRKEGIRSPMYWHRIDGEWHCFTLAGLQKIDPDAILAHISYYEANAFATWKGMRLPTEFEWEAASSELPWGVRWEWTNSAYLPYPGFKIAAGAVGEYNGKFMMNQMVLRGASAVTAVGHSRTTYRNFFHPQYQWQYSGIRLAK